MVGRSSFNNDGGGGGGRLYKRVCRIGLISNVNEGGGQFRAVPPPPNYIAYLLKAYFLNDSIKVFQNIVNNS